VDPVITVHGLRKRYGAVEAVRGIDLEVRRGEIFAAVRRLFAARRPYRRPTCGQPATTA
jgi:ABC-type histidine transport system ATPase subunit